MSKIKVACIEIKLVFVDILVNVRYSKIFNYT